MNLAFLNQTIAKIVKCATSLPAGVGVLTTEQGIPISPILAPDESVSYWVIYLEKQGSGPRPPLTSQSMDERGIANLGAGWRVGRLMIDQGSIYYGNTIVERLQALAALMAERDPKMEN